MSRVSQTLRIIFDYDGTLTYEEEQADLLRRRSLEILAGDILQTPLAGLEATYWTTQRRLLAEPARYGWMVGGQMAAYCDEGAFLLNTATMQALLAGEPAFAAAVARRFPSVEPIHACINWLFHSQTADLPVAFRPDADPILRRLLARPAVETVVLTNSRGDKVRRRLTEAGLPLAPEGAETPVAGRIRILGDVRQYDLTPATLPGLPAMWSAAADRPIDLRRPTYQRALLREGADARHLWVVADGLSLAGSLPLALGIPFFLTRASYTPAWATDCVAAQPAGVILDELAQLDAHVKRLLEAA
jgi:hypothetical protein